MFVFCLYMFVFCLICKTSTAKYKDKLTLKIGSEPTNKFESKYIETKLGITEGMLIKFPVNLLFDKSIDVQFADQKLLGRSP